MVFFQRGFEDNRGRLVSGVHGLLLLRERGPIWEHPASFAPLVGIKRDEGSSVLVVAHYNEWYPLTVASPPSRNIFRPPLVEVFFCNASKSQYLSLHDADVGRPTWLFHGLRPMLGPHLSARLDPC